MVKKCEHCEVELAGKDERQPHRCSDCGGTFCERCILMTEDGDFCPSCAPLED